jgi:hypothetical protein
MLIWRGFGIMVIVIAAVALFAAMAAGEALWGTPLAPDKSRLTFAIGMAAAAAGVWGFHMLLASRSSGRTVVDKETGEEIVLRPKHDLFFIPVKYWTFLLLVLGAFFLIPQ